VADLLFQPVAGELATSLEGVPRAHNHL
jgi:hypothetical protein